VQEYERAVVFRLGRLRSGKTNFENKSIALIINKMVLVILGGAKGPGLFFIMPCVDSYKKVDLRTVSFDVPPQEVKLTFYIHGLTI